jgi:hypothetical protein
VTGTLINNSGSQVGINTSLTHGSGVTTPSDYVGPSVVLGSVGSPGSKAPIALIVDYDQSSEAGNLVFPIGVSVTFNFVIQLSAAVASAGFGDNGVQMEVQEVP